MDPAEATAAIVKHSDNGDGKYEITSVATGEQVQGTGV